MDSSIFARIFSKIVIAIIVLALADLLYLNYWVLSNQRQETENKNQDEARVITEASPSPSPEESVSPEPKSSPAVETKTVETKTVVEKETQTIVQTAQKEIFIPIGTGSTKKNSYEDLAGLEVTIDTNKYSSIESVVFEASIWVQDGNGKVFAQLYNKSDGHPVWYSEISTGSATGVLTTSSKISLSSGNKTYKVQAKTNLVEFSGHVDNARIKITLK